MKSGTESVSLKEAIETDEQILSDLREQEIELLEHIAKGGFSAATQREVLLSEMRVIEDRLLKNRKRISALG